MPRRYRKKFRRMGRRSSLRKLAAGSFKNRNLPERHIVDAVWDRAGVTPLSSGSGGGVMYCQNTIATGAGIGGRIGRRISMKSWHIRGMINAYSAVAPTTEQIPPAVRLIVAYDKEGGDPGAAHAPQVVDHAEGILDSAPASANDTTDFFCLKRWATRERYVTLVDRIIPLTVTSTDGLDANQPMMGQAHFDIYVKLKGLQAIYDADASANPTNGQLVFGFYKNVAGPDGANGYIAFMSARTRLIFYP